MAPRRTSKSQLARFVGDLFARVFSDGARLDPGRCCAYNAFLGFLLVGGVAALRLSAPPYLLGTTASVLVGASGAFLFGALIVPYAWPRGVSILLAAQGALIVSLVFGFSVACAVWALHSSTQTFRYLPGLIVVGATYGGTLWADFGPCRKARLWRFAAFVLGVVVELIVATLVALTLLRR